MMQDAAARSHVEAGAWPGWRAAAVLLLVGVGYVAVADLRLSAAVIGIVALAASAVVAVTRPHMAVGASIALVLIAGTKFRTRDASATLDGAVDVQIIAELALYAVIGAGAAALCWAFDAVRRLTRTEMLILVYAALAALSAAWSASPALTCVRAAQLATVALLAIASVRVLGRELALWTACGAVTGYVLTCAALAATMPFAAPTYESVEGYRFSWFATHPVDAGTLAAIAVIVLASATLFRTPQRKRLLGLPAPVLVAAAGAVLVSTNSRGPLLACIAGIGVLVLLQVEARARTALVLAGGTLAGAYVAFGPDLMPWFTSLANQDTAVARLLFRGETADTFLELNGRLDLWETLQPAIAAHPLLGYGYQASRAIVLDAAPWAAYAHNALMQTVLDLGLIGTLALLAIVITTCAGFVRSPQFSWMRATVGALLVFMVLNSISTESFAGAPGFETLMLFVCALCASSAPRDEIEVIEL